MNLRAWLRNLGLEQYEAAFRENAVDDTILLNLTAEDLRDWNWRFAINRFNTVDAFVVILFG